MCGFTRQYYYLQKSEQTSKQKNYTLKFNLLFPRLSDFNTIISSKNKAVLILVKFSIFFTPAILSLPVQSKKFSSSAAIFTLSSL